jgi:flavin-binding protein dodecin
MAETPAASGITVVGSSPQDYASATEAAVREASRTIRNIRAVEVVSLCAVVADDRVVEYRATVALSV